MSDDVQSMTLTPSDLKKIEKQNKLLDKEYNKEFIKAEKRRRENEIKELSDSYKPRSKWTTSKILMYLIFVNCTIVEIYSMFAMIYLSDLSALSSLIGAVIGETISYGIYCLKSFKSTKEEVSSQLERDRFEASLANGGGTEEDEDVDEEVSDMIDAG